MDFKGKTVLITGASRGIGKATATAFLSRGAFVVGVSTNDFSLDSERYFHLKLDLSVSTNFDHIENSLPDRFKGTDILVNNAGVKIPTTFGESTVDDWDKTMNVNLRSVYFLTQALAQTLAKSKSGRVINIASQSGVAHVRSSIEYGLSKAGVIYLTKSLARTLAKDGVTVNAVSPGRTDTDMTGYSNDPEKLAEAVTKIPLGKVNTSDEIAHVVLFLASEQAHNITGQVIGIDGAEALF